MSPSPWCEPLASYLDALYAEAPRDTYVELRFRTVTGMGRAFYAADRLADAAAAVHHHARRTDVFVGVVARRRQASRRDDLMQQTQVVWADCDSPQAVAALAAFEPAPSIVVASGSADNCHAYWLLQEPTPINAIETANRRVAYLLAADAASTDAARILRPPQSLNHKHNPPMPARLLECDPNARYRLDDIVGVVACDAQRHARHGTRRVDGQATDPLLDLDPAHYVERLTGQVVGRNAKTSCPFHEDRSPSLHMYRDPCRGWYCFGCRRGGTVYDLAAQLWLSGQSANASLRGRQFIEVRQRLLTMFFGEDAAA